MKDQTSIEKLLDVGVRPHELCLRLAAKWPLDRIEEVVAASRVATQNRGGWVVRALDQKWVVSAPVAPSKAEIDGEVVMKTYHAMSQSDRTDALMRLMERYKASPAAAAKISAAIDGGQVTSKLAAEAIRAFRGG